MIMYSALILCQSFSDGYPWSIYSHGHIRSSVMKKFHHNSVSQFAQVLFYDTVLCNIFCLNKKCLRCVVLSKLPKKWKTSSCGELNSLHFFSPTHLELKLVLIIYTRHSKKLSMKYEGKHLSSFSQDDEIALQRWNRSLFGVTSSLTRDVSAVAPTIKLSGILWTLTENKNWTNEIIKEAHSLKVFRMDFFQMVRFLSDGQSRDDLHWGDHVMIRGFVSNFDVLDTEETKVSQTKVYMVHGWWLFI